MSASKAVFGLREEVRLLMFSFAYIALVALLEFALVARRFSASLPGGCPVCVFADNVVIITFGELVVDF